MNRNYTLGRCRGGFLKTQASTRMMDADSIINDRRHSHALEWLKRKTNWSVKIYVRIDKIAYFFRIFSTVLGLSIPPPPSSCPRRKVFIGWRRIVLLWCSPDLLVLVFFTFTYRTLSLCRLSNLYRTFQLQASCTPLPAPTRMRTRTRTRLPCGLPPSRNNACSMTDNGQRHPNTFSKKER